LMIDVVGELSVRGQRDILLSHVTLHRHNPLPHFASKSFLPLFCLAGASLSSFSIRQLLWNRLLSQARVKLLTHFRQVCP
jgi:hypothetical protein